MIKQIFDQKQPEVTLSTTGRVLICVNEKEVKVWESFEMDETGEPAAPVQVTKYEYDTVWVKPIKQSAEAILQAFKAERLAEIDAYDTSDNVNSFKLNGTPMWLSRDMRLTLRNRLNSENAVGKNDTTIWYEGRNIEMQIDAALQLLTALEVYASNCYDVTAHHQVSIMSLGSIAEVGAFDITAGYPEIPEYTL